MASSSRGVIGSEIENEDLFAEADNLRVATGEDEDPILPKDDENCADPANAMTEYVPNKQQFSKVTELYRSIIKANCGKHIVVNRWKLWRVSCFVF